MRYRQDFVFVWFPLFLCPDFLAAVLPPFLLLLLLLLFVSCSAVLYWNSFELELTTLDFKIFPPLEFYSANAHFEVNFIYFLMYKIFLAYSIKDINDYC